MVYHHDSVTRSVDIELDGVCSELQRAKICRDRVLWQRVVSPAVGYSLWASMRRWTQYCLAVVGFETTCAKL
ncbi:MAG: hypothetical protein ACREMS_11830 [Gemmatimonadaceae bacterium]